MNLKLENIFVDTSWEHLFLIRVCFFSSLIVLIGHILSLNFEYLQIGSCHFFWSKPGSQSYPEPPIDFFDIFHASLFYPLPFVFFNTHVFQNFMMNHYKKFNEFDLEPKFSITGKIVISIISIISIGCWSMPFYMLRHATKLTTECF
jgi:hypothetical protein